MRDPSELGLILFLLPTLLLFVSLLVLELSSIDFVVIEILVVLLLFFFSAIVVIVVVLVLIVGVVDGVALLVEVVQNLQTLENLKNLGPVVLQAGNLAVAQIQLDEVLKSAQLLQLLKRLDSITAEGKTLKTLMLD